MSGVGASPLATAIAAFGLDGTGVTLPAAPLPAMEWDQLLLDARIHRIAGLLAAEVYSGALPVTEEQREEVVSLHTEWMEVALLLEADLLRVAHLFGRAGVPHRVLKGPAFAHLDYPDPSLRVFGDIDVLVPSDSFDIAVDTLCSEGYVRRYREVRPGFDRRFGKGASLRAPSGREVDLHRTFAMGPFGLTIDLDDVWRTSRPFVLAGRVFETLDDDHRFLHACYHAAIGKMSPPLVPLRDLAGMLQRIDHPVNVDRVLEKARDWQAQGVIARAIRLAWQHFLLGETAPSTWAAGYHPDRWERRALAAYLDPDMGYAARSFASLRVVPGLRQKVAFGWAMACPDRAFGAGRHGGKWERWREAGRQIARFGGAGRAR